MSSVLNNSRLLLSAAVAALVCAGTLSAYAQPVTGTGDLTAGLISPNWTVGGNLRVGNTSTGTPDIESGGTVRDATAFVGNQSSGIGTVTVSGTDGHGGASTWTNTGDLVIGQDGTGTLNIANGGKVSNATGYIGAESGSTGTVTVSGVSGDGLVSTWSNTGDIHVGDTGTGTLNVLGGGMVSDANASLGTQTGGNGTVLVSGSDGNGHVSTWTTAGSLNIGLDGTGLLQIEGGGVVNSGQATIGGTTGSTSNGVGTATVSGTDGHGHASTWTPVGNIYVGFLGQGTLTIADGGTVSTSAAGGGAAAVYIGYDSGSVGTVTVSSSTGDTSSLSATDRIEVGENGTGTLTISKGGLAHAGSDTYVAINGTATGTLNLLGDASGRGVLETGSVINGAGAGTLVLDGGILRAIRDSTDFLKGFTTQAVGNEGGWIDTNGYNIFIGTAFTGSSSFNKVGEGFLVLSGDSSAFTGPVTIAAGTLQLGVGGTDGIIGGNANDSVIDNGMLGFYRSDVVTYEGTISGSGALSQYGPGTLVLTAANIYAGGTTIKAGILQIGKGGTVGSIVGDVANDGELSFDRSDAVVFGGVISGAGIVSQIGNGTTTLSGVNTYSGGTLISAGTLIGSATSFGSGTITDNTALIIDQPVDADFANAIDGAGSFTKQGVGRLNYTGTGALSGLTTVAAGLLSVNGSLANSAVTVQSGATLGGNGTVGATTVLAGGAIAPGNSIGTLHINGAYSQAAGSIYQVQVDPNTNASDLILFL